MSILVPEGAEKVDGRIGVNEEAIAPIIEDWIHQSKKKHLIVVAKNSKFAEQWASDIAYFSTNGRPESAPIEITFFPELHNSSDNANEAFESGSDRIAALTRLAKLKHTKAHQIWVTTPRALSQAAPLATVLEKHLLTLERGQSIAFIHLVKQLEELDYDSESLCESPGQFARRGGLIDIYPITANKPYRVDFFGDEIDTIKGLDPVNQRSGESIQSIEITASPTLELTPAKNGVIDHLGTSVDWCLVEPDDILETFSTPTSYSEDEAIGLFWNKLRQTRSPKTDNWLLLSDLDLGAELDDSSTTYEAESLSFYRPLVDSQKLADERLADEQSTRLRFLEQLNQWSQKGEQVIIILPNQSDQSRIVEMIEDAPKLTDLKPLFWEGEINSGFRIRFRPKLGKLNWPLLKGKKGIVFVTETELFGRRRNRRPPSRNKALVTQSQVDQLLDFAEMVEGEFVVHLQHGIALYRGITKVEMQGQLREVLSLEFDEGVVLHTPLQESHLISRYVGLSKVAPKLGKIGSNRWAKTREAAEHSTLDLAAKLLEIQAKRDLRQGHAFAADVPWQTEFENAFPFTETPDQMKAIQESKGDMEQLKPMDRLICGDVGFGKTEVAIRAAFKSVMDGKQVAILVPTTILAQQHFINFRDRMAAYPIVVELVSRFRTPAEIKKILKATREGKVDILLGTHRIISKDVSFKALGLVVIDEEQRFGVKHKEVFKQWRETVDILTLSATPIPRTLYMALTGARELSVIETAPQQRKPIQTIVKNYDEKLVCEVIRKEIARGGQVFYLHNRVQTIESLSLRLQELMPEISFSVGHGQMDEKKLERVMTQFVDGRYEVLICTTIIESGLDIPNCNTIIIEGADRFGLSQLYQLRGRVGRFKRQAYAYLLLHKHKKIMDVARKRLHAIRQHNQLGAGFRIAMRDLELRGAGNLLGASQSGHIVGIGFELYCQLLKQSIARLKGDTAAQTIRANVRLDFIYQGEGNLELGNRHQDGYTALADADSTAADCQPIQACIPPSYISETRLRIDMYRRLAMAESTAKVREIKSDLIDRFGKFPKQVTALLKVTEIRTLAEQKHILSVETRGNRLKCRLNTGKNEEYIKHGSRFPRLSASIALKRLDEILVFLRNFIARNQNR